jgi:hypothetical protein
LKRNECGRQYPKEKNHDQKNIYSKLKGYQPRKLYEAEIYCTHMHLALKIINVKIVLKMNPDSCQKDTSRFGATHTRRDLILESPLSSRVPAWAMPASHHPWDVNLAFIVK